MAIPRHAPSRDAEFGRIFDALFSARVDYNGQKAVPLKVLLDNKELFITGIHNAIDATKDMGFLFYKVAPLLKIHGLIEDHRKPGTKYDIQRTSKLGLDFIAWSLEKLAQVRQEQPKTPKGSEQPSQSIEKADVTKSGGSTTAEKDAPKPLFKTHRTKENVKHRRQSIPLSFRHRLKMQASNAASSSKAPRNRSNKTPSSFS